MNIYAVVEGDTEKEVYPFWISQINPNLVQVNDISEIIVNNFAILSGGGYPQYLEVIQDAVADVNDHGNINRFIISIDSEDMTRDEKFQEVSECIRDLICYAQIYIVVQHFCLETWALGNKIIIRKNPTNPELRKYLKVFNVRNEDPELLPPYNEFTRAQFALKYLHKAVNDLSPSVTYSKRNPRVLTQSGYFNQIRNRLNETSHISSFQSFLDAFI